LLLTEYYDTIKLLKVKTKMVTKIFQNKGKLAAGLVLLVLLGCGIYFAKSYFHRSTMTPVTPQGGNLATATEEEKQQAADNKDRIVEEQNNKPQPTQNSPTPTPAKKQVTVTITNANKDTVNAYVSGIFEDGGTCTATFTQGSTVVTRTSTGFKNVSYTQCAPIAPNLPSGGTWSVVVSYSSAAAEGTSKTQAL
jgi:hypothetical protein